MLTDEQVVECRLDAERGLEDGHYILQELSQDILALLSDRAELVAKVERLRAVVDAAKAAVMECAWEPRCDALAEVQWAAKKAQMDWCPKCRLQSCSSSCDVAEELALVATIEWLVERLEPLMLHCGYPRSECDSCDAECENVRTWMRGKA